MIKKAISNQPSIVSGQLIPCGKVKRVKSKNDDSFVFVLIDGVYVPFRANNPKLDDYVGYDLFILDDDTSAAEADLTGFTVVDTEQGRLGVISVVDTSTANTLIELEDGRLLPLHEDFIKDIDDTTRTLTLTLPFQL